MNSVIITGANRGIGFACALQMAKIAPDEQIIIACRDAKSGQEAIAKIQQKTGHAHLKHLPLDLASLASVQQFKAAFEQEPNNRIVALVNNAGIQNIAATQYTKDGFEATFGVNHLGPFYLTLLLLPLMDAEASITFTASGTHDPAQKTGIEPPVYKTAEALAHPVETTEKSSVVGQRRYSTSKLCNILTTYELQRRLANTSVRVNAFDPGMVPGTGLARTYPPFLRFFWENVMPILAYFQRNTHTVDVSGRRLANVAYHKAFRLHSGKYFEGEKIIPSSPDSYNTAFQNDLWDTSVKLTGIQQIETTVVL